MRNPTGTPVAWFFAHVVAARVFALVELRGTPARAALAHCGENLSRLGDHHEGVRAESCVAPQDPRRPNLRR